MIECGEGEGSGRGVRCGALVGLAVIWNECWRMGLVSCSSWRLAVQGFWVTVVPVESVRCKALGNGTARLGGL